MMRRTAANASHNGDSCGKYVVKGERDPVALRQYHADLRNPPLLLGGTVVLIGARQSWHQHRDGGGTNCLTTVAPGATCTIQVVFKPTAAGARTALLELSDNASGSPQSVTLDGTGK
jgi:hypothetical protein